MTTSVATQHQTCKTDFLVLSTSEPILVFLPLDLGPMYSTDRQTDTQTHTHTDRRQTASLLNAPA